MSLITLDIPDATLAELHITPQDLGEEMKMAAAARLYAQHRISVFQAAQFAGLDELTFRRRLGDYGVPIFDLTRAELEAELI